MAVTVDQVLHIAPQASAGEGGSLAPREMTLDQLQFQSNQLAGRDVVYTCVAPDGSLEHRAGMIVQLQDGMYIRHSERLSHLRNVRNWEGVAQQMPFPPNDGTRIIRLISAHVHMAEECSEREREVDRLLSLNRALENRNSHLERHVSELERLLQLQNVTPPMLQAMSPGSHVGGGHFESRSNTASSLHHSPGSAVGHLAGGSAAGTPHTMTVHAPSAAGVVVNHSNDTPAHPGVFPTAPNGQQQSFPAATQLDLLFLRNTFSDRDEASVAQWYQVLAANEMRTINDLRALPPHAWDQIQLPIVIKTRLQQLGAAAM